MIEKPTDLSGVLDFLDEEPAPNLLAEPMDFTEFGGNHDDVAQLNEYEKMLRMAQWGEYPVQETEGQNTGSLETENMVKSAYYSIGDSFKGTCCVPDGSRHDLRCGTVNLNLPDY